MSTKKPKKKAKPKLEQAMQTLEPLKWATDKEEIKVLMSKILYGVAG